MLSVLLLLSSFLTPAQHEWVWSIHPEAHFKVLSPYILTLSTREMPTPTEPIVYHQYNGGSVTDSTMALALVIDHYQLSMPPDSMNYLYNKEFFENTIDQLLSSIDGELSYMDVIGEPGRDVCVWKASYLGGKGVIRGNLIIAGNQYYGLQAFGLLKDKSDPWMNKFLDSFQIIN